MSASKPKSTAPPLRGGPEYATSRVMRMVAQVNLDLPCAYAGKPQRVDGTRGTHHLTRSVCVLHVEHGKLSEDAKEGGKEVRETLTKLQCLRKWRKGRSSRRTGKPCTRGICPRAKAPSLRKDRTKGTQRTRKLSTGERLRSWRNGKERFVDHGEGPQVQSRIP